MCMFRHSFSQEEGLVEVHSLIEHDECDADKKLNSVLEELNTGCSRYISITKGTGSGPGVGKTKLDKERMKLCQREIVSDSKQYIYNFCIDI